MTVTDGPFPETKELIGGFCIIQVESKEEAIDWVRHWPLEDGDIELEIRQMFEAEDFDDVLRPELGQAEERLRAKTAGRSKQQ